MRGRDERDDGLFSYVDWPTCRMRRVRVAFADTYRDRGGRLHLRWHRRAPRAMMPRRKFG